MRFRELWSRKLPARSVWLPRFVIAVGGADPTPTAVAQTRHSTPVQPSAEVATRDRVADESYSPHPAEARFQSTH